MVSALLADAVALWAIAARITEFGFTPNRVAALGENVVLLVNLAWSAVLYIRFPRGRGSFTGLERWQTNYMLVYAVWAAIVVIVFPPVFGYIDGVPLHTFSTATFADGLHQRAHQPGQRSYSRPPEDALGDASGLPATQLHSAWGRMVPDIPDFCHELVVAPAEQQGEQASTPANTAMRGGVLLPRITLGGRWIELPRSPCLRSEHWQDRLEVTE